MLNSIQPFFKLLEDSSPPSVPPVTEMCSLMKPLIANSKYYAAPEHAAALYQSICSVVCHKAIDHICTHVIIIIHTHA